MFKVFKKKSKDQERGLAVENSQTIVDLFLPCRGHLMELSEVPDPVFSQKMVGDGIAFIPTQSAEGVLDSDIVVIEAPVAGEIVQIFPTKHAFGIRTVEGLEILIHVGIDTVTMKGEGFEQLVEVGAAVVQGTPILKADLKAIQMAGKQLHTPVVVTNMERVSSFQYEAVFEKQVVERGTKMLRVILK